MYNVFENTVRYFKAQHGALASRDGCGVKPVAPGIVNACAVDIPLIGKRYRQRREETEALAASELNGNAAVGIDRNIHRHTQQDKYKTDPVPEGKPEPVEPEDKPDDTARKSYCTFSINCATILNNLGDLKPSKLDVLPSDGVILGALRVEIYEGESVFDVLQRVCRSNGIQLEASWTPGYNSAYVEGIGNLYEKDCGELSGWTYSVNGWQPNYGCSRYALHNGDIVQWRYTCDLGWDVGAGELNQ